MKAIEKETGHWFEFTKIKNLKKQVRYVTCSGYFTPAEFKKRFKIDSF